MKLVNVFYRGYTIIPVISGDRVIGYSINGIKLRFAELDQAKQFIVNKLKG